ncbi:MAG: NERD domain-containing protein, partial [Acidobacteriia bacterium]|nr:NERD domain-containing protein [Terriglobia bacterium]
MRRSAGSFIRETMTRLSLLEMGGVGLLIGLSIGFLIYLVGVQIGHGWVIGAYLAVAAVVLSAVRILKSPSYRWNQENLRKGAYAEIRVGQIIEEVITDEQCAVAHGVIRPEEEGDLDHLVATPTGIWVVETKYRPVPQDKFSRVLRHIEESIDWVREWAPIGT